MTLRRTPLSRYTPLRSSKPLVSHSELTRSGPIRRVRTHEEVRAARRPLVSPEERRARKLLKIRSGGVCEMDGRNPATDAHHRRNRSQGGLWAVENLLHLCHEDHMRVTVNVALACERGWSVRSYQEPARVPVWLANRGFHLLRADGSTTPVERSAA